MIKVRRVLATVAILLTVVGISAGLYHLGHAYGGAVHFAAFMSMLGAVCGGMAWAMAIWA